MDKTFEDIISDVATELTNESPENPEEAEEEVVEPETEDEPEVEDETDNTDDSDNEDTSDDDTTDDSEDEEESFDNEDVEENDSNPSGTKDAEAFARMRKENKQFKQYFDFFDQKAKEMGMQNVDELIQKTKEADLAKSAQAQGIPIEIARKLQELETKLETQERERAQEQEIARDNRVRQSFDTFVQANNLDEKSVNKLAKDLINDGVSLDFFKNIPENMIQKVLKSYLPSDFNKQKELEKKEKIKKEVPVSSKSNGSASSQDDKIDEIAKMLLERP